ncbi:zinc-binding dehydrogenase [Algoriphagus boritolerans]
MIAAALGATVIAVDISDEKLALAQAAGASLILNGRNTPDIPSAIAELSKGGVHVSVDALGSKITCYNSIASLRKRGRHIQIGLMAGSQSDPPIPMHLVIAKELEILGSHGMQAHAYPEMMQLIFSGKINPEKLIGRRIPLEDAADALIAMDSFQENGMVMIDRF